MSVSEAPNGSGGEKDEKSQPDSPHTAIRMNGTARSKTASDESSQTTVHGNGTAAFVGLQASDDHPKTRTLQQRLKGFVYSLPPSFDWLKPHVTSSASWKNVIRVALSAWTGVVLGWFIDPLRIDIGNIFYITTLIAFLLAASDPFASVLQRSIMQLFILAVSLAWVCLMMWIAWLARGSSRVTQAEWEASVVRQLTAEGYSPSQFTDQIDYLLWGGTYIDWKANSVFLIFSSFGASMLLWYKANLNPLKGSLVPMPVVLVSIGGVIGHYLPFPGYTSIAQSIFYPTMLQIAINLFWALVFFPESRQHQFLGIVAASLGSFRTVLATQKSLLEMEPASKEWSAARATMKRTVGGVAQKLSGLRMVIGSLDLELSPRQLNANDVREIYNNVRLIGARSFGMQRFYNIVVMHIHREGEEHATSYLLDRHLAPSEKQQDPTLQEKADSVVSEKPPHSKSHLASILHPEHSHLKSHLAGTLHQGLNPKAAVGLHESQQYALLEEQLGADEDVKQVVELVTLLHDTSEDLLSAMCEAVDHITATILRMRTAGVLTSLFGKKPDPAAIAEGHRVAREKLKQAIEDYSTTRRLELAEPFVPLFDKVDGLNATSSTLGQTTRRGFFWCCQYVHSMLRVAEGINALIGLLERLDAERTVLKFWLPKFANWHISGSDSTNSSSSGAEEAPDDIPGLRELGHPVMHPRNPDFSPPVKTSHFIGEAFHAIGHRLSKPDFIYAIKAAPLIAILSLPAYFPSSARFAYENRIVWVIITVGVTFSPYLGDTAFQFVWRLVLVFAAVVIGMVIWYIGNADGNGTPYGFGAVLAVAFVPLSFLAIYYPVPSQRYILLISCIMPLGYDWRSGHTTNPLTSFATPGWQVAYRRWLAIAVAVTSAFIWSWLPPALASQKTQIRITLAKTVAELGVLITGTINYASLPSSERPVHPQRIIGNALAIRAKLMATVPRKNFAKYEFTLRGRWPEELYDKLIEHQLELCDLCAQLAGILSALPPAWIKALLNRTHLDDARFLADISASITLVANALRNGSPMPAAHTTLLTTAYQDHISKRLNLYEMPKEGLKGLEGENAAVPRHVDVHTLVDANFQRHAVAVSTIFALLHRLDCLMVVTKELVGEVYSFYSLAEGQSREPLLNDSDHGANAV